MLFEESGIIMGEKYVNPPVVEVVCEFKVSEKKAWDLAVPGLLYNKIKDLFPKRQQSNVPVLEIRKFRMVLSIELVLNNLLNSVLIRTI